MSLDPQPPADRPAGRRDEWVARSQHRREYLPSVLGQAQRGAEKRRLVARLALAGLAALGCCLGLGLGGFQLQVGINSLVIALLAVGLNIVVGWAGLLDLGYVAFFGFGAYGYALLSSHQLNAAGRASPAVALIAVAMVHDRRRRCSGCGGLAVAAADRRLPGDRDAVLRRGVRRVHHQRRSRRTSAGPTGSPALDPVQAARPRASPPTSSYYYLLVVMLVIYDGGAAAARHLAHGPSLAGGPRGPARGGGDDDPRQPGEADGLQRSARWSRRSPARCSRRSRSACSRRTSTPRS